MILAKSENLRPVLPYSGEFQRAGYSYAMAAVREWGWSHTFGRWGASVTFDDGEERFTWPREVPPAAPLYEEKGETTKDGWLLVRSPRFPQEATIACPKCRSLNVSLVGGHYKQGHFFSGFTKCNACNHCTL